MGLTLVLGGVRSGKSAWAEALATERAAAAGGTVRYLGTADPADPTMAERVRVHRARRPAAWESVDAGDELAPALADAAVVLFDGLGGWIAGRPRRTVEAGVMALLDAAHERELIVVAEQAGEGLLPLDGVARAWLDLLGESSQRLSRAADRAVLLVAGRAVELPAPA